MYLYDGIQAEYNRVNVDITISLKTMVLGRTQLNKSENQKIRK